MTSPTQTAADARNRAVRTFFQGLLVDIAVAVVLAAGPKLLHVGDSDFVWSKAYWATVGLLAARSAIVAGVAYVMRHVLPPARGGNNS